MTIYITQGRYPHDALRGMIRKPEDRAEAVAELAKAVGGKLLDYYVTFGDYDFLVVIEGGKGKSETDVMAALNPSITFLAVRIAFIASFERTATVVLRSVPPAESPTSRRRSRSARRMR